MGRVCCEVTRKKMSCFRAFDSNLPFRDVQIMGGGAGWRGAGGGQKKGNRGRDRCGKFKSSSKGVGGGRGQALIQSLRLEGALPQNNFYLSRGLACSRRSQRTDGSWNRLQFDPKLK